MALIDQSAPLHCFLLDPLSFPDDWSGPAEVCVGGRDVADALVTAMIVVAVDEVSDRGFEGTRQIEFASRMRFFVNPGAKWAVMDWQGAIHTATASNNGEAAELAGRP